MTDARPQFGEYATPEEQDRRAGRDLVTPPPASLPAAATEPAIAAPTAGAAAEVADRGRNRPVGRAVTLALLAYGLVNVIMTVIAYGDVPRLMNQSMKLIGIEGEFTNFEAGRTWGMIASIVLILGWTVTAALSVLQLRRRRSTWWIPLVGAVVTTIAASLCLSVPMFADPAFVAYMDTVRGG